MNILAYSAEQQGHTVLLQCSDGRSLSAETWEDAVGFLLQPTENNMAVCWNVDSLVNAITSLMPKSLAKQVIDGGRVYTPDNRKLYYRLGRKFGINHIDIYALHRYSDKQPDNVCELAKLAQDVIKAYEYFGIKPTKLTSPVAVYGDCLEKLSYQRACDLPESAFGLIEKCSEKAWIEWREVYKLGHWNANEVIDLDLQSAYPSLMARLPDLRGATFFESDEMPEEGAYSWGEMEGLLNVTADVTPFLTLGKRIDTITTDQNWMLNKYEWGKFEFKHGWFFKLPQYYKLPFKETMQTLYQARQNDNPLVKTIAKAISVGIGGRFAQRYDSGELGEDYQPIYSRLITSRCALKVADMIWRHGISKDVIAILVDGFLAENSGVEFDLVKSGMGSWRVNQPSPFLVASLLYAWDGLNSKHPNGQTYSEVMAQIQEHPRSSIIGDNVDLNLLQRDRYFQEYPRTGKELLSRHYSSIPIVV